MDWRSALLQRAVGDRPKVVEMFVYGDSDSHSMYRHPEARVSERIGVESVTIDDFLQGRTVDVIKMDIEGNEPYALEGMTQTIARSKPLVLFAELAPAYLRRAGIEPRDYLARLEALGFSVQLIDEVSGELRPVTVERDPSWKANLLCQKT